PGKILRGIVFDAIEKRKSDGGFVVNDFDLEQTHLPHQQLEDIPDAGKVWVIRLAADDSILTRSQSFQREIPIQIGLQKVLCESPREATEEIDRYEELEDELRDCVQLSVKDHKHFAWTRTQALKDENGTPFNFVGLRQANTFEAFFTAYFKVVLTPENNHA